MKYLEDFPFQIRQVIFAQIEKNLMVGLVVVVRDKVSESDDRIGISSRRAAKHL